MVTPILRTRAGRDETPQTGHLGCRTCRFEGQTEIEPIKRLSSGEARPPNSRYLDADEAVFGLRALKAGALGYVMKAEAINHVAEAIFKVLQGKIYVSPEFAEKLIFKAVQSAQLEPDLRWMRYQIANWKSCNSSAGCFHPVDCGNASSERKNDRNAQSAHQRKARSSGFGRNGEVRDRLGCATGREANCKLPLKRFQ